MKIENLYQSSTLLTSNVYLVSGETNVFVDVGSDPQIIERIKSRAKELESIYLTHMHPDHWYSRGGQECA